MINLSANKLAKFFDRQISDVKNILIVSTQGTYDLFGRFRIENKNLYFLVTDTKTKNTVDFSSLKNAVAWCVLEDEGRYRDSRRLQTLDLKLCSLQTDIEVHRRMIKVSSDSDSKLLYILKLQEDSYKRKIVIQEIETFINTSKTIQAKKFDSEKEHKFKCL